MSDLISRHAAIDAICKACSMEEDYHKCDGYHETSTWCDELVALRALPSTEPEIIRCKDCKYSDENWRRVSVKWLPCMDVRTGSNWYCASAERKTDD